MKILIAGISLSCGFLLLGCSILFIYADGPAIEQAGQTEGNKKIIVIYKGSKKDPEAKVSMDGKEKGKLASNMYLTMLGSEGSHAITVGENRNHSVGCVTRANFMGGVCSPTGIMNYIDMPFHEASISIVFSESETAYLLVERNHIAITCCDDLSAKPNMLTDFRLREIKSKDGEKLAKKYQAMQ